MPDAVLALGGYIGNPLLSPPLPDNKAPISPETY
jgi:hypothetical protein